MKRRTSSYLVLVETTTPNKTLDELVERCPTDVETTAVYSGMCGLRFRCVSDDNLALNTALEIVGGRPFILRTGYGVNQREIAQ